MTTDLATFNPFDPAAVPRTPVVWSEVWSEVRSEVRSVVRRTAMREALAEADRPAVSRSSQDRDRNVPE